MKAEQAVIQYEPRRAMVREDYEIQVLVAVQIAQGNAHHRRRIAQESVRKGDRTLLHAS